ncbi:MAG: hypothetical protein ACRDNS_21300, partial [Trebonia sp.]
MSDEDHWLTAGVVGRPHGLDESFHVAGVIVGLLRLGMDVRVAGETRRIERLAGHERRLIVRLDGGHDRAAAQALGGQQILVARADAPVLGEDEWWASDLEGCAVRDG